MLLLSFFDYRRLEKYKVIGFLVSVVLLVAVLIFGEELNGGKRWLKIAGQSIQPSEIAKFGMMLYMCAFMSKKHAVMRDFKRGMAADAARHRRDLRPDHAAAEHGPWRLSWA